MHPLTALAVVAGHTLTPAQEHAAKLAEGQWVFAGLIVVAILAIRAAIKRRHRNRDWYAANTQAEVPPTRHLRRTYR